MDWSILIILLPVAGIAFVLYFVYRQSKGQKRIESKFDEIHKMIEKFEEDEKKAGQAAMDKFRQETEVEGAKKGAYFVANRYSRLYGLDALKILENKFSDQLTEEDHNDIKYLRSRAFYVIARFDEKDTQLLDKARELALELLRDDEYCSNPHVKLKVQEHLRHLALEKQILRGG